MEVRDPAQPQEVRVPSIPVTDLATLQGSLSARLQRAKSSLFWSSVIWWATIFLVIVMSLLNLEVPFVEAMFIALVYYISRGVRCCQPRGADVATYIVDGPKGGCCNPNPLSAFDTTHPVWSKVVFRDYPFLGDGAYPWDSITKRELVADSRVVPLALNHCAQADLNPNPTRAMELLYTLLHDNEKPCCGNGGYDVEAVRAQIVPHAAMLLLAEKRTAQFALQKTFCNCCRKFHNNQGPILALAELLSHPSLASPAAFPTSALADAAQLALAKLDLEEKQYTVHFAEAVLSAVEARLKAPAQAGEIEVVAVAGASKPDI